MVYDSIDSEELAKLIENKKEYLKKVTNTKQAQYLQKEIMFLQNDIMPIVLKNTSPVFCEIAQYAIRCYERAIKDNCNGLLCYLSIKDEYNTPVRIGIANCRDTSNFGAAGEILISCNNVEITNMNGGGTENVEAINIPIHYRL